jgi:outer membrane protein OmpA-like peptidoglycan-associated protein
MTLRLAYAVRLGVALVVLAGVSPASAQRQDRSFNPQLFHPAPGPDEFVNIEPGGVLGHLQYEVGLFLNYARNEFTIYKYDSNTSKASSPLSNIIANRLGLDLWAALGIANRLQIAIALPMTLYQNGDDFRSANPQPNGTTILGARGYAFNDPRIYLKVLLYGKPKGFQLGLSHWLSIPLGDDGNFGGEKHFTGFSGEPRLSAEYNADRWRLALNFGFLWRAENERFFSTVNSQMLTYGGAIAVDAVVHRLTVLAEIYGRHDLCTAKALAGASSSCDIGDINSSPLELDIAAKIWLVHGLSMNLGVGNGLVGGVGSPQPRVYLGFVFAPSNQDRDKDGVPDGFDKCPDVPEDKDGFQDKDGCPDIDNDGDGIDDKDDKCPNQAEDFDSFEDDDGCPEPDNDKDGVDDLHDACPLDAEDHKPPKPNDGCPLEKTDTDGDGIMDSADKCPTDPEDKDGFEDTDGCPDPDNDNDGIPDNFDQCPNEAEDADGFQDDDGCPDPDNDKDGILDKDDKCPNEPETINGYKDEDGCPDQGVSKVRIEKGQIVILDKVFFATGKATILPKSFNLLDQVALTIKAHPEFKIRVEGHTDSQGKDAANIRLSQDRANSVMAYLIKKGIDPVRLIAAGYGSATPIADNKTSKGREANRRVEFHIVVEEKAPAKKPEGETPADENQTEQPDQGKKEQ